MLVTTPYDTNHTLNALAQQIADSLAGHYEPRKRHSIPRMMRLFAYDQVLVVRKDDMQLYREGKPPFFYHPGTAVLRVQRLLRGLDDPMITSSTACAGDVVIDCTAGMASDALVFAHVVGDEGRVVALESELAVSTVVKYGLAHQHGESKEVTEAMRRVEMVCSDYADYLSAMPDKSADIVYFDPMFQIPVEASSGIAPLRELCNPAPLNLTSLQEARRVARKCVIFKDHRGSSEFLRLGFTDVHIRSSKMAFGVMMIE